MLTARLSVTNTASQTARLNKKFASTVYPPGRDFHLPYDRGFSHETH
jgi:hypothetical protein